MTKKSKKKVAKKKKPVKVKKKKIAKRKIEQPAATIAEPSAQDESILGEHNAIKAW